MKKIVLAGIAVIFLCLSSFAQDAALFTSWKIDKIQTENQLIDYTGDAIRMIVKIDKSAMSYNGSCIPCTVKEVKVDGSSISFISDPVFEKGCCFFDNEKDEVMKMARVEGDYVLKDDKLEIKGEKVTYYLSKL